MPRASGVLAGSKSQTELLPDSIGEPLARRIRETDWQQLDAFTCSTGAWYEDDVQAYIRNDLRASWEWRAKHLGTSVLVLASAIEPARILAVGSHEIDDQRTAGGAVVEGSRLIVGAVRTEFQGFRVDVPSFDEDRHPVSVGRYLMQALIDDLPETAGVARAVIARENHRSLRLCDRVGLGVELDDKDRRYVQRLGRLA